MIVPKPEPGALVVTLPATLSDRVRTEAVRYRETPTDLALEVLGLVFAPGPASLVAAVLDRASNPSPSQPSGDALCRRATAA